MRADRLISILLLLQANEQMTARDLATRLEVSERTIQRDMEALSIAGIPVTSERGSSGGWRLLDQYRADLTGLTQAEIQSLFLTKPTRLLADLGLRQAAEGALIKLFAALPALYHRDAEFFRQRIHIDGLGWERTSKENMTFLPTLQEGLWQDRQLLLTYRRNDEVLVERTVSPLGLVAKNNTWYLVAAVETELRTYRVSRLQNVVILDQTAVRPEGFNLAAYWDQSTSEFRANLPRYPVTVRVSPEIAGRMPISGRYARVEKAEIDAPDAEGWVRMKLLCETDWEACEYLLSFGANVEVLEPVELRALIVQAARDVLTFYERRGVAEVV